MANFKPENVKRFVEDISKEAADKAYNGGNGSTIVDALPAKGVEGTTYLLRKKEEGEVFKAQAYAFLYTKVELPFSNLVFIEADFNALKNAIETKLDPSLNHDVDFNDIANLNANSISRVLWKNFIENRNVVIVTTEEEVLNITEDVDCIIQNLGEIGIENLDYLEYQMNGEYLAGMYTWLNTLTHHIIKQNDKMVEGDREVIYNSELESGQTPYSFTEWQDEITDTVVGTFTDTYEYDTDTLLNLKEGDCYFITLTPEVPEVTYSYTQYVFDQGVYTLIGGGAGGAQKFIYVYAYINGTESSLDFTMQVDVEGVQTFKDIFDYLETKGFIHNRYGSIGTYPVVGGYNNSRAVTGLQANYEAREEGEDILILSVAYLDNGHIRYQNINVDDPSWIATITYLGQENQE